MIKSYLRKQRKILNGFVRTYMNSESTPYAPQSWWDHSFYGDQISDSKTISPTKAQSTAMYHYASIEQIILRHLINHDIGAVNSVFDIGSGAGHWLKFYRELGAQEIVGSDISEKCHQALAEQFSNDPHVQVHHGLAIDVLRKMDHPFDLINAIGVMFHIVDDLQWQQTINEIARGLKVGGHFVAGGHFGLLNNVNVQYDQAGSVNKRLRSQANWRKQLKSAGFRNIAVYRNPAYLWINDTLPENNVLIATK